MMASTFLHRTHVMRAHSIAATPDDVRTVVRFSAQIGLTRAWRRTGVLNETYARPIFA
jgi:hypothetical protein